MKALSQMYNPEFKKEGVESKVKINEIKCKQLKEVIEWLVLS